MGLRKIAAYTGLALLQLFSGYSGAAIAQKSVDVPAHHRVISATEYHAFQNRLSIPSLPVSEGNVGEAVKSHILHQSLLMESKAQTMDTTSPYSISNLAVRSNYEAKINEFTDVMKSYERRAMNFQDRFVSLLTPKELALTVATGGTYGQLKEIGLLFESMDMVMDLTSDVGRLSRELSAVNSGTSRNSNIFSAIRGGYNGLLGRASGRSVAYFSLLAGNPYTAGWLDGDLEFFMDVAKRSVNYPVNADDDRVGKVLLPSFRVGEDISAEPSNYSKVYRVKNELVVRNPSSSFMYGAVVGQRTVETRSKEDIPPQLRAPDTGFFRTIEQGFDNSSYEMVFVEMDRDTIRYVWGGPKRVVPASNGGSPQLFLDGFYVVEGFPVRRSELQKYFEQNGYNLPSRFDVAVVELEKEKFDRLAELRTHASQSCATVGGLRGDFDSIESRLSTFNASARDAISSDLGHLENLCSFLFSYQLQSPFVVTFKQLAESSAMDFLFTPSLGNYMGDVLENARDNFSLVKEEMQKSANERRIELRNALDSSTGILTRRLGGYSGLVREIEHGDYSERTERVMGKFLSSTPYKILRLVERIGLRSTENEIVPQVVVPAENTPESSLKPTLSPPTPKPTSAAETTSMQLIDEDKPCRTFDEHPQQMALSKVTLEMDKQLTHYGDTVTMRGEITYTGPTASILGMPQIVLIPPIEISRTSAGYWVIDSDGNIVDLQKPRPKDQPRPEYFCINAGDNFAFELIWNLKKDGSFVLPGNYVADVSISLPPYDDRGHHWNLFGFLEGPRIITVEP